MACWCDTPYCLECASCPEHCTCEATITIQTIQSVYEQYPLTMEALEDDDDTVPETI